MDDSQRKNPPSIRWTAYVLILAALWTAIVGASLGWNVFRQRLETQEVARAQARAAHEKDLDYRHWNTTHGGVYVPVTETTQPNPYLDVPERDIQTPSGRRLTLMNPAYMVRQVHELAARQYGRVGHITSLRPIRPANMPDPWETEALEAFERGTSEVISIERIGSADYLRLMRPLRTEKGCLRCHAVQGYREGDIRGGISVAVPMAPFHAIAQRHNRFEWLAHGFFWLVGLAGMGWGTYSVRRRFSERMRAEEGLRESEERHRAFIQNIPVGVYRNTLGPRGRFFMANPAIARMFGFESVEDFLRTDVADLYTDPSERKAFSDKLRANGSVTRFELRLKKTDGTPIWGAVTATAVRDEAGQLEYFDGVIEDITERKLAEEAFQRSEGRYRTLVENLPIGLYRNTPGPKGRFVMSNPAIARMFGFDSVEEFLKTDVADLYVDPGERKVFSDKLRAEGSVSRVELRLKRKDGTPIWGAVTARAVRGETGEVEYFDGMIEDITERRIGQQRIEAAAQLVAAISPLGDRARLLELVIHRATELLNADFGVIVELDPETGAIGAAYPANFPTERIPDGAQVKGQGVLGRIARGEVVWTTDVTAEPDYVGYPAWHPKVGPCIGLPLGLLGKVLGMMLLGREKGKQPFNREDRNFATTLAHHGAVGIDRTRRMEMLQAMSVADELTGLHNRRGFLALAEQQLKVANRTKKGLAFVFADLDGLKWINDRFGHREGDMALIAAAGVLKKTFRESDIAARMGGDEFAVLAVEAAQPSIETLVARLRENVEAFNAKGNLRWKLSLSAGVAHYDPDAPCSLDDLLTRADALMYDQKRGRERNP